MRIDDKAVRIAKSPAKGPIPTYAYVRKTRDRDILTKLLHTINPQANATQPSVVLHRPRLGSIGLGIYSSGAVLIKKDGSYLPPPKFDGKEKTGRSTTDYYYVRMQLGHDLMVDTNSKRGQLQSCNSNNILRSPIGLFGA